MPEIEWDLLKKISEQIDSSAEIPEPLAGLLAERLEAALANPRREHLKSLKDDLFNFWLVMLQKTSPEVLSATRGEVGSLADLRSGFLLGQIDFAHHVAAQTLNRREGQKFSEAINGAVYKSLISSLWNEEASGKNIAARICETEESVSRKLKVLRAAGIVDFRREGTSCVNFLTPIAKEFLSKKLPPAGKGNNDKQSFLSSETKKLPPYLQNTLTFAAEQTNAHKH
jgi:DNA-binding transcriptional ArsR family regulator